ncbi:MAG: polymerase tau subunit [Bacteroidetes bacterium]|nr:polymerase tau subunit [Bacteroidota bacterium]
MDSFVVSARKYRPSTFKSVVGQDSLTTTLRNAIKSKKLAHAYLFCGPRGVGKTTCARIFAKTINCEHLTEEFEACNQCESCKTFNDQRSYNIHELDAASNNGVDDIRSLTDQVRIPPQIGNYSVYIIDEVHMLSSGAFNAFLKTLEEPPAHAIFILATTEKHKIIPTILSRCQIYDFNRISINDTVNHLKYVASSEHVTIEESALNIIAQKSDGGMRDALSIFDQLVSFSGNAITYQNVIDNLNVLDYEYYFKLVNAFLQGNVSEALLIFDEVLNKGFEAQHFITGLSSHLRDVLVSKDASTIQLLEVGVDIGERYRQQAQACPVEFIFDALKISNDCDLNYRISKNKRLLVEIALIRISQLMSDKKKNLTVDKPPLKPIEVSEPAVIGQPVITSKPQVIVTQTPPTQPRPVVQTAPADTIVSEPDTTDVYAGNPVPKKAAETKAGISQAPPRISISNIQSEKSTETTSEGIKEHSDDNISDKQFTSQELIEKWKIFANQFQKDQVTRGFLLNHLPSLENDNIIGLLLDNKFQEKEISQIHVLEYLRKELGNNSIRFQIDFIPEEEQKIYLNPQEVYKKMVAANPALAVLRKNLDMEID